MSSSPPLEVGIDSTRSSLRIAPSSRGRGDDDIVEMLKALEDDDVLREQVVDVLKEWLRSD